MAMNYSATIEFTCQVEGGEPMWEIAMHTIEYGIVINTTGMYSTLSISNQGMHGKFKHFDEQ